MQHQNQNRSLFNRPTAMQDTPARRYTREETAYRSRSSSTRERVPLRLFPVLLFVLAMSLMLIACVSILVNGASDAVEPAAADDAGPKPVKSTSRALWEAGKIPYLYQIDDEWAAKPYAGGTVADSACGPTCMSIVYVSLTGKKDLDPAQMAAFSERNGYVDSGMTSWMFMTDGARRLGLTSRELSADEGVIRQELAARHPIIASVAAGDFTTKGHFIVLVGTDAHGRILIRDPNSPDNSTRAWDLSRILSQTRNLWVFSR